MGNDGDEEGKEGSSDTNYEIENTGNGGLCITLRKSCAFTVERFSKKF